MHPCILHFEFSLFIHLVREDPVLASLLQSILCICPRTCIFVLTLDEEEVSPDVWTRLAYRSGLGVAGSLCDPHRSTLMFSCWTQTTLRNIDIGQGCSGPWEIKTKSRRRTVQSYLNTKKNGNLSKPQPSPKSLYAGEYVWRLLYLWYLYARLFSPSGLYSLRNPILPPLLDNVRFRENPTILPKIT